LELEEFLTATVTPWGPGMRFGAAAAQSAKLLQGIH
jgi:hypothetical protein